MKATQPGIYAPTVFQAGGKQYAAQNTDGTFVIPVGAVSGFNSHPARPGDYITVYGVGFGPVTPNINAGQIVQQCNPLTAPVQFSIGGVPATSQGCLAPQYIGLYQFNLVVPNVAASDAVPLTFTQGGVAGTQTLYIAVQN